MIATAWNYAPEPKQQKEEVGPQPPELISKLDKERVELGQKIERLKTFVTLDGRFRELSWEHKKLLEEQLGAMSTYESILVRRMMLLNQPQSAY